MYTKGYRLYPDDSMDPPCFVAYGKKMAVVKLPDDARAHVKRLAIEARKRHERRKDPSPETEQEVPRSVDILDQHIRVYNKFVQLLGNAIGRMGGNKPKTIHTISKRPTNKNQIRHMSRNAVQKTNRKGNRTR